MFVTTAYVLSATAVEGQAAAQAVEGQVHTEVGANPQVEHDTFPPFDPAHFPSQLLWLAITFGAFYFLVSKLITPQIGGIIAKREGRIASDLAEAKRMKDEADASIAKYEQELSEARIKGQGIAAEARDAVKAKADAERAQLEAGLAKKIADAEQSIAAIKTKALAEVETVAEDTASEIVEQLTGVTVTKAAAASAVKASKV
ncbi:F0F1 ATP synthase subunit B [Rhizobium sp. KVB221]|uniref:ATP synthase subunit b n=1 Tax=Rhizobium setariae TaxID=2801340 RepID=A0A936YID5_9HYPH|nr:F0F1 ATP synthase subunit B [Rhizobium setariae]MBL0370750.1 F0F1 ATP synthase subunit B [Rhizobium setariae]